MKYTNTRGRKNKGYKGNGRNNCNIRSRRNVHIEENRREEATTKEKQQGLNRTPIGPNRRL